jgi:ABC-type polysaccharide/polyol phosphate transport system ATPase subunit
MEIRGTVGALVDLGIGINGDRSARQNVKFVAKLMALTKEQTAAFDEDVEAFAEIGSFYDLPFDTYSSGMKLRVLFAMVTHFKRDILVIDEVFGVGDAHFADKAHHRMVDLIESAKTIVLASHSQDLLRRFTTHCLWMNNGEIYMAGKTEEILEKYTAAS